jgi:hypothetical protein
LLLKASEVIGAIKFYQRIALINGKAKGKKYADEKNAHLGRNFYTVLQSVIVDREMIQHTVGIAEN